MDVLGFFFSLSLGFSLPSGIATVKGEAILLTLFSAHVCTQRTLSIDMVGRVRPAILSYLLLCFFICFLFLVHILIRSVLFIIVLFMSFMNPPPSVLQKRSHIGLASLGLGEGESEAGIVFLLFCWSGAIMQTRKSEGQLSLLMEDARNPRRWWIPALKGGGSVLRTVAKQPWIISAP